MCCVVSIEREKLKIPEDKPYIILKGMGRDKTFVEWGDHDSSAQSPTFLTMANDIVVKTISFRVRYKCLLRFLNYLYCFFCFTLILQTALIIFFLFYSIHVFFVLHFVHTYSLYPFNELQSTVSCCMLTGCYSKYWKLLVYLILFITVANSLQDSVFMCL